MHIPKNGIGKWAAGLVKECSVSLADRVQKGSVYRSVFLSGSEDGTPQTYNKTRLYIEKLSSNLFSPDNLRFKISAPKDAGPDEWAKGRTAAAELNDHIAASETDLRLTEAIDWALIKGKVFVKLLWNAHTREFDCYVLQPEYFGVLREDISTLDRQEAFFQSTYMTFDQFERRIASHEDRKKLVAAAKRYIHKGDAGDYPDRDQVLKQIIVGGMNPFRVAGQQPAETARNVVQWLGGPSPIWSAKTLAEIIRLDELWVWDTERKDWTTIQIVGDDCVIEGRGQQRNIFSCDAQTDPKMKDDDNPLHGRHPFIEVCVNPLADYFWGTSEVANVTLAQKTLNARVDGINKLLRKQEDPPKFYRGISMNADLAQRLRHPGGWLNDNNPNAQVEDKAPEIPAGLYESLHEAENIFEAMADTPPVMQGRGESGVRSQAHAETLVRTSSPRLKRRAIRTEKIVSNIGALGFAILQAHDGEKHTAYVPDKETGIQAAIPPQNSLEQMPAPKMKAIEFTLGQVHEKSRVSVDSHSSSPIFANEARALVFDLVKIGAISPTKAIELTHPPDEDELVAESERHVAEQEQSQAALAKANPEAALKAIQGGKKH